MRGVIDSTLREGEQTVGVSFSPDLKLEIIRRLCRIGVEEIEVGIADRHDDTPAYLIRKAREAGRKARFAVWCRCRKDDISVAALAAPDVLSLSIPVSDMHIEKKLGKSREWVLAGLKEAITFAKKHDFSFISLGLEDATRADPDFVEIMVQEAKRCGIDRIRLADTVGVACPAGIGDLVRRVKTISGVEVGVHMHNDFGMATANSIAAIDAGGDWVDATILGLGERTGNARLEEVAGYLTQQREHPYRIDEIPALSAMVAEASGTEIDPHRPIIGRSIFACETGLHLQGLQREPSTYEPYPPEHVNATRTLVYGAKVGRLQVMDCLKPEKLKLSDTEYDSVVAKVREEVANLGHPLPVEDFSALVARSVSAL